MWVINMGVIALKRLRMGGKEYFIDERLHEIRNVKNPFDAESVSPDLIDFWVNHCEQQGEMMVCNLSKGIKPVKIGGKFEHKFLPNDIGFCRICNKSKYYGNHEVE